MSTMVSRRDSASRGLLACTVVSEPSWPVFMAWSMSSASPPRTSPTTMRSGRMRRALRTRSRMVIAPRPSMFGGPGLQADHVVLVQLQFGGVLDGDDALVLGDEGGEHVERVVLPEPGAAGDDDVAAADARRPRGSRPTGLVSVPKAIRSATVNGSAENLRMVSAARRAASGGMMALTREPSGRRASTMGLALVDAPADPADDLVDDPAQVGLVAEVRRRSGQILPARST